MSETETPRRSSRAPPTLARVTPNLLSLGRLVLGIAFPWIAPDWRVGVVLAAALSDMLDGVISRLFRTTTSTGRILDPLADKVFVVCVLAVLLAEDQMKAWHLLLAGFRDFAVLAGVAWMLLRYGWSTVQHMPPSLLGKITTAAQFVFLLSVIYWHSISFLLFVPTALFSVLAGLDYLRRYFSIQPAVARRAKDGQ